MTTYTHPLSQDISFTSFHHSTFTTHIHSYPIFLTHEYHLTPRYSHRIFKTNLLAAPRFP